MSYTRSTGRNREPRGQNVLCSVMVSVVATAATWALPVASAQIETVENEPTIAAGFAARKPSVDFDDLSPVPFRLVLELPDQLRPASIADASGQRSIASHSTYAEVLDYNRLVFANESSTQLVEIVPTSVGNFCMQASQLAPGFVSILRAFLLPGQTSRQEAFSLQLPIVMPRVYKVLSSGKRHQAIQPDVYPNSLFHFGKRLNRRVVTQDRNMPSPSRVKADGHTAGLGVLRKWSRPDDAQGLFHFGQKYLAIAHPERTSGELSRTTIAPFLKFRVLSTLGEEVRIGGLKVSQRLLKRDRRDFVEERKVFGLLPSREPAGLLNVGQGLLSAGPRLGPVMQSAIVNQAAATNCTMQQGFLVTRRIETIPEAPKHAYNLKRFHVSATTFSLRHERRGFRPRTIR